MSRMNIPPQTTVGAWKIGDVDGAVLDILGTDGPRVGKARKRVARADLLGKSRGRRSGAPARKLSE
jgi:hypothetical protein